MAVTGVSAGLSGMQVAAQGVALSATNVANVNSTGYRARSLEQAEQAQGGVAAEGVAVSQESLVPGGSNVDLATEAVNLKTQGTAYQANAKFLKAQERMLGAALDMKV
jgi:flagellar hook protein FlgE